MKVFDCFNSTLVQLKVRQSQPDCLFMYGFNSTLVQLKVKYRFDAKNVFAMFQFYLSSIKRYVIEILPIFILLFQFYLSSIKRKTDSISLSIVHCFNSTLVQLKARYKI